MSFSRLPLPAKLLGVLALVCVAGLLWNLFTTSDTERAQERFLELIEAIDEQRFTELPDYFHPDVGAGWIQGVVPRAERRRLQEVLFDAAAGCLVKAFCRQGF